MDILHLLAHLDDHLVALSQQYGYASDLILFLIIFSETGLVIAPLLPGDSLLFVAGAVAAGNALTPGPFNLPLLWVVLSAGAFLGNQLNFQIGRWIGPKVFHWERSVLFNPRHLAEAHAFYEHHGGKTIVLARFVPIVRTYAPFVAGGGTWPMDVLLFLTPLEPLPGWEPYCWLDIGSGMSLLSKGISRK